MLIPRGPGGPAIVSGIRNPVLASKQLISFEYSGVGVLGFVVAVVARLLDFTVLHSSLPINPLLEPIIGAHYLEMSNLSSFSNSILSF